MVKEAQLDVVEILHVTDTLDLRETTSNIVTYVVYRAVLAHPPRTINGRFRVTEQGEMITQNFGSTGIAERTMDIYTAAVLAEQFITHVEPLPKWRNRMKQLGEISCASYQTLIKQKPFIQYFRQCTPEVIDISHYY
jgi:phosphoenolpyruvate carboxylase